MFCIWEVGHTVPHVFFKGGWDARCMKCELYGTEILMHSAIAHNLVVIRRTEQELILKRTFRVITSRVTGLEQHLLTSKHSFPLSGRAN